MRSSALEEVALVFSVIERIQNYTNFAHLLLGGLQRKISCLSQQIFLLCKQVGVVSTFGLIYMYIYWYTLVCTGAIQSCYTLCV